MEDVFYLIVPLFANTKKEEKARRRSFRCWRRRFARELRTKNVRLNFLEGFCGKEDQSVDGSVKVVFKSITPKGTLVRHKLLAIAEDLAKGDIEKAYVALIDGSGKIEYSSLQNITECLFQGHQVSIGCRKGQFGIPERRIRLEKFENFLVSESLRYNLPDAQAGCWGFRADLMKDINFSARGYAIELDLIITALQRGLDVCFVPIEVKKTATKMPSNWTYDANKEKLKFIAHKLNLDRYDLRAKYDKFKDETNIDLKDETEYLEYFDKINFSYKRKLKCKFSCRKNCNIDKLK